VSGAARADTIQLYAAGSLRAALNDVSSAFETRFGVAVHVKYGPSGVLKDEIVGDAKADVFASANMAHPQALADAGKSTPVLLFARNKLCALVKPALTVTTDNLLDWMLDPNVKVGTSTPKADPSGDYAFEVFGKAEAIRRGARAILEAKALQLSGAASSAQPPNGRNTYGWHIAEGRVDMFLAYCTATREALQQNPDQQSVPLPDALAVSADYGVTVINGAASSAQQYADYMVSADGQRILVSHGFAPAK
jgi:ABC-type molybdate transport system substrate-binding protein